MVYCQIQVKPNVFLSVVDNSQQFFPQVMLLEDRDIIT